MKRSLILLVVVFAVLAGCKATVMSGKGGEIILDPTAEPLTGAFPVGRWACYHPFSYERVMNTNTIRELPRCSPWHYGVIELRSDGVGWWLTRLRWKAQDYYVRFKNDTTHWYAYPNNGEIRWNLTGDELLLQSAYNYRYKLTRSRLTENVFALTSQNDTSYLMINIESPSYVAMQKLIECVEANSKRKIFELETCPRPPWVAG